MASSIATSLLLMTSIPYIPTSMSYFSIPFTNVTFHGVHSMDIRFHAFIGTSDFTTDLQ